MSLRGDSYSSAEDVAVWTRHLIEGETTFNTTTAPTLTEVEDLIDEVSSILNIAFRNGGFAPSAIKLNSTATQSADFWTRTWATSMVELTAPFQGLGGEDGDRSSLMRDIEGDAEAFVKNHALGFKREGVTVSDPESQGIAFTGETKQSDRVDKDNTSLEKPLFKRHQFDNPS